MSAQLASPRPAWSITDHGISTNFALSAVGSVQRSKVSDGGFLPVAISTLSVHEHAALLQQVTATIGGLSFVSDGVCQRRFSEFAWEASRF